MDNSVLREKEIYDSQSLKRETYNIILGYAQAYYNQYIQTITKNVFCNAEGKHILELGSRAWYRYIYCNNIKPKKITCINISNTELKKGIQLVEKTREIINIEFIIMDANKLAFNDKTFDMVFGSAILHHLDFPNALNEIHRVLKTNGHILFHEPLGINPVGKLVRILTPKARTIDEKPLCFKELNIIESLFKTKYYYEQLFSVPFGVVSRLLYKNQKNILTKFGYYLDRLIDEKISILRPLYRYVVLHGEKKYTS